MSENVKAGFNALVLLLSVISVMLTPYIIITASVLSAIDYYLMYGVLMGIVGFFIGSTLASITMVVVVVLLALAGYYTSDLKGEVNGG